LNAGQPYSNHSDADFAASSDEALITLYREGRPDAFEVLVKRYEKRLFNYIRRMVSSTADAEDLFQETFLRVYRHLDRFRTSGSFRAWAYRIATNVCKDHLRRRRRRGEVPLERGPDSAEAGLMDRLESPGPWPDAQAQGAELAERLESALAGLPVKHRAVFLMARYDQMPYDAIARTLHIPVGTVKSRMNKAVHTLLADIREAAP
jgi:RNA polymerase sigma-70 factor, ECF subfamily